MGRRAHGRRLEGRAIRKFRRDCLAITRFGAFGVGSLEVLDRLAEAIAAVGMALRAIQGRVVHRELEAPIGGVTTQEPSEALTEAHSAEKGITHHG